MVDRLTMKLIQALKSNPSLWTIKMIILCFSSIMTITDLISLLNFLRADKIQGWRHDHNCSTNTLKLWIDGDNASNYCGVKCKELDFEKTEGDWGRGEEILVIICIIIHCVTLIRIFVQWRQLRKHEIYDFWTRCKTEKWAIN